MRRGERSEGREGGAVAWERGQGHGNVGAVRPMTQDDIDTKKGVVSLRMVDAVRELGNGWTKREAL